MSPADVVAYLEKLPSMAWPYGLVVTVQENGIRVAGDDARIKRNREELVRLLENAGVKVDLWSSA
jgi:myo-inositol-1-phosphate synthase